MRTIRYLTTATRQAPHRPPGPPSPAVSGRSSQRGQVLAIFALMSVVLLGGAAFVTDAVWWWTFEQRMQRAADAAALAGAVHLPGRMDLASSTARAEAKRNGFDDALTDVVVTPSRDPNNERRLIVDIDAPAETHFARVFGLQSIPVAVAGAAEFMPRVPMGSPENYYGVFGTLRGATFTQMVEEPYDDPGDSGWRSASSVPAPSAPAPNWSNATSAFSNNDAYASTTTNGASHRWGGFGIAIPAPGAGETLTIANAEVRLNDAYTWNGSCSDSRIRAQLSWDGGTTWTATAETGNLGTNNNTDYTLGGFAKPGGWAAADFTNANFRVQLVAVKGCSISARQIRLDHLQVRVSWNVSGIDLVPDIQITNDPLKGPGTPCANGAANCYDPDGTDLNPRGFWATMNTRGASNVNGDAHQPYYDTAGGTVAPVCPVDGRACYDPALYYNYAVEMPPNSTGGYVYVFDPGFCATATNRGTGDRWFGSSTAVSSWYQLYADDLRTPYNLADDRLVVPTSDIFANLEAADSTMGGSGGAECRKGTTAYGDGRDYHNSWYLLNPGSPLTGGPRGTIYRIHTTGTDPDPGNGTITSNTDGEQSFALFAEAATGGTPRIYGLGSMQMFTPLSSSGGSTYSEFYLAQIGAAHAGRTVEIQLWDPGDTAPLTAGLEILVPGEDGVYRAADLTYTAAGGTTNNQVNTLCNNNRRTTPSNAWIYTERTGSQPGEFNGCWLTILVHVAPGYTAQQDGWWKIRYNMTGTGTSNDVTTWKVGILGNPVHLVPVGGG